jgi:hypothetical protein
VGQLRSVLRHYGKIAIFWMTRSIFIFTESHFMVHRVRFMTIAPLMGVFLSQRATAAEPAQKVRIGYPSSAVSTLPFDIAKEKGFYSKAGLDVEYIQMRTAIAPQAILNGNINFFTSPQSGISAAVSGLPLVVVLVLYKDTPWVLVTSKEIMAAGKPFRRSQDDCGKIQGEPERSGAVVRYYDRSLVYGWQHRRQKSTWLLKYLARRTADIRTRLIPRSWWIFPCFRRSASGY